MSKLKPTSRSYGATRIKQLLRILISSVKWLIIIVIGIELLSFLFITASNFILYGHAREGSRSVYDPYTLFLMPGGVRPTAHNSLSPVSKYNKKIWLFGGSTMRAASGPYEKTIPSFLSKHLNSEGRPLHFTITNFGVHSFNSLLETKYLQKMLIESTETPDVIVFYDGANDVTYFAAYRTPYAHHAYLRTRAFIESYYRSWFGLLKPLNAALYSSFTMDLYNKFHEVFIPMEADSPLLKKMADLTEKRYDHVNRIVKAYGAEFLLIWQPMLWVEDCQVPANIKENEKSFILNTERFATVRHNFAIMYRVLVERLNDKSYFVSFQNALCERVAQAYKPDGVHLTAKGRKILGQKMGLLLKDRFFNSRNGSADKKTLH